MTEATHNNDPTSSGNLLVIRSVPPESTTPEFDLCVTVRSREHPYPLELVRSRDAIASEAGRASRPALPPEPESQCADEQFCLAVSQLVGMVSSYARQFPVAVEIRLENFTVAPIGVDIDLDVVPF